MGINFQILNIRDKVKKRTTNLYKYNRQHTDTTMSAMAENQQNFTSKPRPIRKGQRTTAGLFTENQQNDIPDDAELEEMANQPTPYANIMYDRRIVRGNTYAQAGTIMKRDRFGGHIFESQDRNGTSPVLAPKKRNVKNADTLLKKLRSGTPPAVDGRQHATLQTELYLEELADKVEEADAQAQTDAFLDRPSTPLFVPAKTGADVATQILPGELFDFDIEVRPILEVLVGKTCEQAVMEVCEEEELATLRSHQRRFQQRRAAELAETQRLAEQDRRREDEKKRRVEQQREALRLEKETADKVAARLFAVNFLEDLVPAVLGTLNRNGYFSSATARDLEADYLPWLINCIHAQMDKDTIARQLLDLIIREVITQRRDEFGQD